jgi:hypothetical protein
MPDALLRVVLSYSHTDAIFADQLEHDLLVDFQPGYEQRLHQLVQASGSTSSVHASSIQ